jgi:hypothetical protein
MTMEQNQQDQKCDDHQQVGKIDIYVFSSVASLQLAAQLRPGLPPDTRYVATVSGYGTAFAITEANDLADLVNVIPPALVPPNQQPQAAPIDPETARALGPYYLKTSKYHRFGRFIRYHLQRGASADQAIQVVRDFLCERQGHQEAQLVVGKFRMLVYIGSDQSLDDLDQLQADLEEAVTDLRNPEVLEIVDYVSRSENAPPDHRAP